MTLTPAPQLFSALSGYLQIAFLDPSFLRSRIGILAVFKKSQPFLPDMRELNKILLCIPVRCARGWVETNSSSRRNSTLFKQTRYFFKYRARLLAVVGFFIGKLFLPKILQLPPPPQKRMVPGRGKKTKCNKGKFNNASQRSFHVLMSGKSEVYSLPH